MSISDLPRIVLILGSAPDAVQCRDWSKSTVSEIVAINNAWRLRSDWDFLIAPDDFPPDRLPASLAQHQKLITSRDYVPANNLFGGVFYAGGTMAFTAGYWALATLRPSVMAFLGCDMVYSTAGKTHFYGQGRPDPLRRDPSLRNLEAKSARLMAHAQQLGCACVRLSSGASRLVFPSARFEDLPGRAGTGTTSLGPLFDQAKEREARLQYFSPTGTYWDTSATYDTEEIDALDRLWLATADSVQRAGSVRSERTRRA
jgi:hypothetical protein